MNIRLIRTLAAKLIIARKAWQDKGEANIANGFDAENRGLGHMDGQFDGQPCKPCAWRQEWTSAKASKYYIPKNDIHFFSAI